MDPNAQNPTAPVADPNVGVQTPPVTQEPTEAPATTPEVTGGEQPAVPVEQPVVPGTTPTSQ